MKKILLLLSVFSYFIGFSQTKSGDGSFMPLEVKYLGCYKLISDDVTINPEWITKVSKNESAENEELQAVKKEALKQKMKFLENFEEIKSNNKKTRANEPVLISGFTTVGSASFFPPDNSAACGANGQLVAMVNSVFKVYNATGGSLTSTKSLAGFFNPLGSALLTVDICDPKVIYDNQMDRFIVFGQTCEGMSNTSQVLLAFSKTNDASGEWYYYALPGDPFNQNEWFDYPKVGVSDHDFFVTGNMFSDGGGYTRSLIYQVDKIKCFAGNTLGTNDAKVWSNISNTPFTLVPLSNGRQGGYGNNMFLACKGTGRIKLYEISNAVQNAPTITYTSVTIPSSSAPGDAPQSGSTTLLDVGDGRAMDGYYLNGTIHFVFHSDVGSGFSGINYTRMSKVGSTWTATNKLIKETGKDLSYPSIASIGYSNTDQASLITYSYCSSTEFPGIKAVYCANDFTVSNPILLQQGQGYIELGGTATTRWGDYSSCAKDYGASIPTVWSYVCFGASGHFWSNRLSKISTSVFPVGTPPINTTTENANVYPVPANHQLNVDITLPETGSISIQLFDIQGKMVKQLYESVSKKGQSSFSFNTDQFADGNYILSITNNNKTQTKKITISNH